MGKDDVILKKKEVFILNSSFNLFVLFFIIFISHCDMKMLIMMPAVALVMMLMLSQA